MPKLKENQLPEYRLHKQSGQAIVTLNGRDHLLGKHDTAESRDRYNKLTAEWQASRGATPTPPDVTLTIEELLAGFLRHAKMHYRKDGKLTSEYHVYTMVMGPLRRMYGELPVGDFGPLKLTALMQEMIRMDWSRKSINKHRHRICNIFNWGVANELLPAAVADALKKVPALQKNRTQARETPKVPPVTQEQIDAVLPHVSRPVAAMIQIQQYSAMRPGEVCIMRGCDLDTTITKTKPVWEYRPESHKNEHYDLDRLVQLGPKARAVLEPFLKPNPQAYLFSPADAQAERLEKRRLLRRTPLSYGNSAGTNRRRGARTVADHYEEAAYRKAITRGCEIAFKMPAELREPTTKAAKLADTPEKKKLRKKRRKEWHVKYAWSPNQIRHTTGTAVRDQYGLEGTQHVLGHAHARTTEIYAEKNIRLAREIAAQVG